MRILFKKYDEQVRKDALSLTEKGFLNTYKHFGTVEELRKIYTDIQNEPKPELKQEIEEVTDEATDFPDEPPYDKEADTQDLKNIIKATDDAQPEGYEEERKEATKALPKSTLTKGVTRASRMKELIAEGVEKSEIKRIMEGEGFEFKQSIFYSEYRRLTM